MAQFLRIALWNANGLGQHSQEVKTFLTNQKIDIMLISETHFTTKNFMKIHNYKIYDTKHPDGTAHGGTAIIIKSSIKHYELEQYQHDFLQATSVAIAELNRDITISAIYCPPKHTIKKEQFETFYKTLGPRFIAGGDYNAKHSEWGSRLITPKGRELYKAIQNSGFSTLSTGEPTYWPTDNKKTPDIIDFCVFKGISNNYLKAESCLDLSSDHSPIIVTYSTQILEQLPRRSLCNRNTNWTLFQALIDEKLSCNIPLRTEENINQGIDILNKIIQEAAKEATPIIKKYKLIENCPLIVKQKIAEKRKIRRSWQNCRSPNEKTKYNRACKQLKHLLNEIKNQSIQDYLSNLTATEATDYSLWKATKCLKRPQTSIPPIKTLKGKWARSNPEKATAFAEHFENVFKPFPSKCSTEEEKFIHEYLRTPIEQIQNIKPIKVAETSNVIHNLNTKKTPGIDSITGQILKELPSKAKRYLTILFNAMLRLKIFPQQWKIAQIILIPKPGKDLKELTSYRPISLLSIVSKVFEKLLLKRLKPIIKEKKLTPIHQFGFREQHSTIEQIHRVASKINQALQTKVYCSAAFLDISQAFDKVWHTGLLFKLKKSLPHDFYMILNSYLSNRKFNIKYLDSESSTCPIESGVPQGSVLGPILYILYTADLPITNQTTVATFADDTAIMALHPDHSMASKLLQENLNKIEKWLKIWRIKANETKSIHVTFTMKKGNCPPVTMNGQELPQAESAKYLGMHLDRRLTWKTHIWKKRLQLEEKRRKMYWLLGWKSQLTTENKLLLYKTILKPVWTYGIQLWGTASHSNIEILQRFQNKILKQITNLPRYVPNWLLHQDLQMSTIKEEAKSFSKKYQQRIKNHPNELAVLLLEDSTTRRLKRLNPLDLST